jgi:pyruvate formate lyase activating enzyme
MSAGRLTVTAVDPIEKKPLFHFLPGSNTLSVACDGCNLTCPFCQNHLLSQRPTRADWHPEQTDPVPVETLLQQAELARCPSISFTYSEPLLQLEYILDVAERAKQSDLQTVLVTNGQINAAPLADLKDVINAANIDLKSFSARSYRTVLGGRREASLAAIETLHRSGVWIEITTLVVPGFNDSIEELEQIAGFIAHLDRAIPWHVSAFHPAWKWQHLPATPVQTLRDARQIGLAAGLFHVYTGNIPGDSGEKTLCPGCGAVVVDRTQYRIRAIHTQNSCCRNCGTRIAGTGFP